MRKNKVILTSATRNAIKELYTFYKLCIDGKYDIRDKNIYFKNCYLRCPLCSIEMDLSCYEYCPWVLFTGSTCIDYPDKKNNYSMDLIYKRYKTLKYWYRNSVGE